MIKISNHIYIHWLTVALFAVAYITRTLGFCAAVYAVMLLHELAHAAAAVHLQLGISHIILYPFGVNLKVCSRMLCTLSDTVILYLSGPCVNIVAALICGMFWGKNMFYYNNIILFVMNLLPILPLDGGQIAERILSARIGTRRAQCALRVGAVVFSALLCAVIFIFGELSINTAALCSFLLAGVFTGRPKYSRDFVRELSVAGKKRGVLPAQVLFASIDTPPRKIASEFNPSKAAMVVLTDDNDAICCIKTKEEIVSQIIKK